MCLLCVNLNKLKSASVRLVFVDQPCFWCAGSVAPKPDYILSIRYNCEALYTWIEIRKLSRTCISICDGDWVSRTYAWPRLPHPSCKADMPLNLDWGSPTRVHYHIHVHGYLPQPVYLISLIITNHIPGQVTIVHTTSFVLLTFNCKPAFTDVLV